MYKVNVEILKMLKETEFAPTSAKALGLFINTPKLYGNLSNYFKRYIEWFNEAYSFATIPDKVKTLYSVCNTVYDYYGFLNDFILESDTFQKMYQELSEIHDFYLSDNFDSIIERLEKDTHSENLLSVLNRVFYYCKDCVKPVTVREDITRDEIDLVYRKTLDFFIWIFKEIHNLGYSIYLKNEGSWPGRAISNHYCLKPFTIDKPALALVSFCSDTTRYYSSNQKVISASLVKTNKHKCFGDRSFGFLY